MAGEIDRLELQVEAQATKANNQLDKMVGKLDAVASSLMHINSGGLAGLASGVSKFAQASSQLSNVKTADFTRLAKNIQGISSINTQQIHSAASAMTIMSKAINSLGSVSPNSLQVAEVAKSIGKLGGANVQRAITNLPALEKALHSFMTTMSQAPSVSRNVIKMTDALASLASQGGKVGTAANSVNSSLTTYGKSADKAAAKTKSLASMIGTLNANFFWMKSAVQKLYKFTESSMDFLETVNYFEVAMRDIGNSAVETWDGIGYESAEAYAKSFSERAKQLTEKMTGYAIDEDGNAEYSSVKNLGMDPDKVLQYQATFAQISSSIGVAEESALNFSKALTMLGADWASLRNLTFDQGWEKFASALAGQSRAVRSLGIDITNATLQEYAYKYGLEQAVSEMNQATEAQLRLLAILDQSKVAYGDFANTIESPANQIRMLQQNVSNLGRVFGNLFLPILQKTLPYINGKAIALQKLFTWIGQLLGIQFDSINSSMGGMSEDMSGLVGDAEDFTGELDDANDAAKKLNKTLMPWHEINNLTTNESSGGSGSGSGGAGGGNPLLDDAIAGALADYEKIWNEAFERMENKAQEIAGQIEKFLEPVKNIIQDFVVGDYFQAGKDTSALVAGIFNFFADAIDNVDWEKLGQNMGDFLAGIDWLKILAAVARVFWEALKGAFELWSGAFSTAPLETALISMALMPKALKAITASKFVTGIAKLASKFKILNKSFNGFLQNLDSTGQVFSFNTATKTLRDNMTGLQKGVVGVAAVFGEFLLLKDGFYDLAKGADNVVASLGQIAIGAGVAATALYVAFGPAGLVIAGITGVVAAIVGIKKAFDEIRAEEQGNIIKNAMLNPGGVPIDEITAQIADAFNNASSGFDIIKEKSSELDSVQKNIQNTWLEIYKIQEAMEAGVLSVDEGKQELERLFGELADLTEQKFSAMNTVILSAYGENGSLRAELEQMGVDTEAAIDTMITYGYQNSERAKEIAQQLVGMDINSDEYKKLSAELATLTGEMSSLDEATSDFSYDMTFLQDKIDLSKIFLEDGTLDADALERYLKKASDALEDYEKSLDEAGKEISRYWTEIANSATATDEEKTVAKSQLEYIPTAIENMKSDAELQVVGFTDMLQNEFIAKTDEIIEDAQNKWNSKSGWDKFWGGVIGPSTESEYVREAVGKHKANIDELSSVIEESFGDLKEDGVVWGSEAMEEIYSALFDSKYVHNDITGGKPNIP